MDEVKKLVEPDTFETSKEASNSPNKIGDFFNAIEHIASNAHGRSSTESKLEEILLELN